MDSHLHSLIFLQFVTSQKFPQWPKQTHGVSRASKSNNYNNSNLCEGALPWWRITLPDISLVWVDKAKQHLAWCRSHNNEEVEMAILKGLKMQQPDCPHDRILKLVPSWDKCTWAPADDDENFNTINDLYLTW
jgi:hypothetical protein